MHILTKIFIVSSSSGASALSAGSDIAWTFGKKPIERCAGDMALDNVAPHLEGVAAPESMRKVKAFFDFAEVGGFHDFDIDTTFLQIIAVSGTATAGRAFIECRLVGQ